METLSPTGIMRQPNLYQISVTDNILSEALQELIEQCSELYEAKTEGLTAYQINFLKAISDGIYSGFSAANVIQEYKLGSSANVAVIKKALLEKDLVIVENKLIKLADPIMGLWLQKI